MINILFGDEFTDIVDAQILERAAQATLSQQGQVDEVDLSLVIEGDERLRELNQQFLDIDAPTDVLSFPAEEEAADPDTGTFYLGDVIISYPRALEQANAAGHGVLDEMQLLVVHGVLHLMGHDHAEPEEKMRMWSAQQEILRSLNVKLTRLPE